MLLERLHACMPSHGSTCLRRNPKACRLLLCFGSEPDCAAHVQLISIANNSKERKFRQRADDLPTPKLLARVEQLRLLSKLEELKLLSLLQNNGKNAACKSQAALMYMTAQSAWDSPDC
jgi:hypothetical protein